MYLENTKDPVSFSFSRAVLLYSVGDANAPVANPDNVIDLFANDGLRKHQNSDLFVNSGFNLQVLGLCLSYI